MNNNNNNSENTLPRRPPILTNPLVHSPQFDYSDLQSISNENESCTQQQQLPNNANDNDDDIEMKNTDAHNDLDSNQPNVDAYSEILNQALHNLNRLTPTQDAALKAAVNPQALIFFKSTLDHLRTKLADFDYFHESLAALHRKLETRNTGLLKKLKEVSSEKQKLTSHNGLLKKEVDHLAAEVQKLIGLLNDAKIPKYGTNNRGKGKTFKGRAEHYGRHGYSTNLQQPPTKSQKLNNGKKKSKDVEKDEKEFDEFIRCYKAYKAQ